MEEITKLKIINNLGFNQNQEFFYICTNEGFQIFTASSLKEVYNCKLNCDIKYVEMLYSDNVVFFVGNSSEQNFSYRDIVIWDSSKNSKSGLMQFKSDVQDIKVKRNRIIVLIEMKLLIYSFPDLQYLDQIVIPKNEIGICSINLNLESLILAYLDKTEGHITINQFDNKKKCTFKAHNTKINIIQLNQNGSKIATTSNKGTLIRIFDTTNGQQLQELRTGTEYVKITSICFDLTGQMLNCACFNGFIHQFKLQQSDIEKQQIKQEDVIKAQNQKSTFQLFNFVNSYFGSEWGFAKLQLKDQNIIKITFSNETNFIIAISLTGIYFKIKFDASQSISKIELVEQLSLFKENE